jgi:hypothetical protein
LDVEGERMNSKDRTLVLCIAMALSLFESMFDTISNGFDRRTANQPN